MTSRRRQQATHALDEQDVRLFREAVSGIAPLRNDRVAPLQGTRIRPARRPRQPGDATGVRDMLSDALDWSEPIGAADSLKFLREGIQRRQLARLQRGQPRASAVLDLHGLTAADARERLSDFLARCTSQGYRCVRIVHGKGYRSSGGQPVLKTLVARWLRMRVEVLAFCSAAPRDGGTGALSVLLRAGDEATSRG